MRNYKGLRKRDYRELNEQLEGVVGRLRNKVRDKELEDRARELKDIPVSSTHCCAVCGKRGLEKNMVKYKTSNSLDIWDVFYVCNKCNK